MNSKALVSVLSLGLLVGSIGACAASNAPDAEGVAQQEQAWTQVNRAAGMTGQWWLRGHEDLTRFGVDEANQLLRANYPTKFPSSTSTFFPTVKSGDLGYNSTNPLVQGNFASDVAIETWPFESYRFDELLRFYDSKATSFTEWQDDPKLMSLHFLRDLEGPTVPTKVEACFKGRERTRATRPTPSSGSVTRCTSSRTRSRRRTHAARTRGRAWG
jgi:hypothetical protein